MTNQLLKTHSYSNRELTSGVLLTPKSINQ